MYGRLVTFVIATTKMTAADRSILQAVRAAKAFGPCVPCNPRREALAGETQSSTFNPGAAPNIAVSNATSGDLLQAIVGTDEVPRQAADELASVAEIEAALSVGQERRELWQNVGLQSDTETLLFVLSELPLTARKAFEAVLFEIGHTQKLQASSVCRDKSSNEIFDRPWSAARSDCFATQRDLQSDKTQDLHTVLTRGNVGQAPPLEMLQPVNLRFSLNLKSESR